MNFFSKWNKSDITEKFKLISITLLYILMTYFLIWLMQNRIWVSRQIDCKLFSYRNSPLFHQEPFEWKNTGVITLWFDDNWSSQYKNAFPIMKKFGFKGTVSVITATVCTDNHMIWPEIYALEREGWEVVSEGKYPACDPHELETSLKLRVSQIADAKKDLEKHQIFTNIFVSQCGTPIYVFPDIQKKVLESYLFIRIADSRLNDLPLDKSLNVTSFFVDESTSISFIRNIINQAKEQRQWLIITFHQVDGYPYNLNISTHKFEEIMGEVKKSGLPVVLPSQVLGKIVKYA